MARKILTKTVTKANFTLTLASLAAASARQSTMINNSGNYESAMIYLKIKSGTAPTAGGRYSVFLLRGDDPASSTYRSDAAGASDAAITINNAVCIGNIVVTNSANTVFYGEFDTRPFGPLGPEWGIAIKNDSDQALNATEGDHLKEYEYVYPEVQ